MRMQRASQPASEMEGKNQVREQGSGREVNRLRLVGRRRQCGGVSCLIDISRMLGIYDAVPALYVRILAMWTDMVPHKDAEPLPCNDQRTWQKVYLPNSHNPKHVSYKVDEGIPEVFADWSASHEEEDVHCTEDTMPQEDVYAN